MKAANIPNDSAGGSRRKTVVKPPAVQFSREFSPRSQSPDPLDVEDLSNKLSARGFSDGNTEQARYFLNRVGYQHASGYMRLFEGDNGALSEGATARLLHRAILFDRKFQAILIEHIGLFELQFRAQYSYELTKRKGAFAHRNPANFKDEKIFDGFLKRYQDEFNRQIKNRNGEIINAYEVYGDAPTWLAVEVMSFGTLSMLYNNTRSKAVRSSVASFFGATPEELSSWMKALSSVRNVCAHFGRLCGTKLVRMPKRIPGVAFKENDNPFYIVLVLLYLLRNSVISPDDTTLAYNLSFIIDLLSLFNDFEEMLTWCRIPEDWLSIIDKSPLLEAKLTLPGRPIPKGGRMYLKSHYDGAPTVEITGF